MENNWRNEGTGTENVLKTVVSFDLFPVVI